MNNENSNTKTYTAEIRIKRCYGCGSILQSLNPNESGYVPKEKLESGEECLCERCFKLRNYNLYTSSGDVSVDFLTVLNNAKNEGALILYILNAFSIESSILSGITISENDNCIAVINKRDILDKTYSDDYLIRKANRLLNEKNVFVKKVLISSGSSSNLNIDELFDTITKERHGKNVYFIGASQTGKSSLVNAFLNKYVNKTKKLITTSPFPGTTLDVISIPLDEKTYIYDTPGNIPQTSIYSFIEKEKAKYITPRTTIKPESYQSKAGQSFLLSNFARLDYISGGKTNFSFYKSNDLTLSRVKLEKADQLFNSICKDNKNSVKTNKIKDISEYKKVEVEIIPDKINKISIYGLADIQFVGKSDQKILIYVPNNVVVKNDTTEEGL